MGASWSKKLFWAKIGQNRPRNGVFRHFWKNEEFNIDYSMHGAPHPMAPCPLFSSPAPSPYPKRLHNFVSQVLPVHWTNNVNVLIDCRTMNCAISDKKIIYSLLAICIAMQMKIVKLQFPHLYSLPLSKGS